MNRRDALGRVSLIAASSLMPFPSWSNGQQDFTSNRPAPSERNFTSKAVEKTIQDVKKKIKNPELSWLFENCFPNTLDTTVSFEEKNGKPDTFVITGDIHAMWLRDSTAQVWPYLPLVKKDEHLSEMIRGVINRQTQCVLIDPYANAFNKEATGSEWESDLTDMKPELHERKWEIDSLCYTVRLAYHYWKTTGNTTCFTDDWKKAAQLIVQTFREQQRKDDQGPYHFMRKAARATDTLTGDGYGNPVKPVGLISSAFRPSDDATIYLFLIPSNYFAVTSLEQLAEISTEVLKDQDFADECKSLGKEVSEALEEYATAKKEGVGEVLAFEVDGFGNQLFMDDANVPSLLSLPYLGCLDAGDSLYQQTRDFIWSEKNPYFFKGKVAEGIGGPHIGIDMVWPMSIIMYALTSESDEEIKKAVKMLLATHGGTGFMHESFHKDDPKNFTRKWFAWANTLFGELILKLYNEKPALLASI